MSKQALLQSTIGAELVAGDICTFRTSPLTQFSPTDTHRYAAIKVLLVTDVIVYVVLDGVFAEPPSIGIAVQLAPLRRQRFHSRGQLALHSTPPSWCIQLLDFVRMGNVAVSADELALIPEFPPFGSWKGASSDAEGEWRWHYDREAATAEVSRAAEARDALRKTEEQARLERRKTVTWDTFSPATLFASWIPSPPFPSAKFVDALRTSFDEAVVSFNQLGKKPNKRQTRSILRELVVRINALDTEYGEVIETEEREDLCQAICDLAAIAQHENIYSEVAKWRSW